MKPLLTLSLFLSALFAAEIQMPKHQTYYISGVAFDTKVYCADFSKVIEQQAQKIKALEAEVAQLRRQQQEQLSKKLEQDHQRELEKAAQTKRIESSASTIIISDKPIE